MKTQSKKQGSLSELIVTYWVSSWISPPLIPYLVVIVLSVLFIPEPVSTLVILAAGLITLWFSARFGARYIQKRYTIPDPKKILKWTLIWYVIFGIANLIITAGQMLETGEVFVNSLLIVSNLLMIPVFYYASKKALLGRS